MKVVQLLVEKYGVRISATDRWHRTPLHEAIVNNHAEIAAYLKRKGAVVINRLLVVSYFVLSTHLSILGKLLPLCVQRRLPAIWLSWNNWQRKIST